MTVSLLALALRGSTKAGMRVTIFSEGGRGRDGNLSGAWQVRVRLPRAVPRYIW